MKNLSTGAIAVATALALTSLAAPSARAATMSYDEKTDTCTLALTDEERASRQYSDPEYAALSTINNYAEADSELGPAILKMLNAMDILSWDPTDEDAEASFNEGLRDAQALFVSKGMVADNDAYDAILPPPRDIIWKGFEYYEAGPPLWESNVKISREDAQANKVNELNLWYENFYRGYSIENKDLRNEVTEAVEAVRGRAEIVARQSDALQHACGERRSATVDLLADSPAADSETRGSSGSGVAFAAGILTTLAAVLGILAAALPMIKPYLPAQAQALLP